MSVSATQLQILQHTLGISQTGDEYRNHFCTGAGSLDWDDCNALVKMGYMLAREGTEISGGNTIFRCTEAGKEIARKAPKP